MLGIKDYVIAALAALLVAVIVITRHTTVTMDKDVTALTNYVNAQDDGWVICSRDCAFTHYDSYLKWEGCFSLCKDAIKDTGSPAVYEDDSYTKKAKPIGSPAAPAAPAATKEKGEGG